MDQGNNSSGGDKEDRQDPATDNADQNESEASMKTTHSDEVHKTDALIVRECFLFYPLLVLHADLHLPKE